TSTSIPSRWVMLLPASGFIAWRLVCASGASRPPPTARSLVLFPSKGAEHEVPGAVEFGLEMAIVVERRPARVVDGRGEERPVKVRAATHLQWCLRRVEHGGIRRSARELHVMRSAVLDLKIVGDEAGIRDAAASQIEWRVVAQVGDIQDDRSRIDHQ